MCLQSAVNFFSSVQYLTKQLHCFRNYNKNMYSLISLSYVSSIWKGKKKNRNIFKRPLTSGKMLLNKIKPSGKRQYKCEMDEQLNFISTCTHECTHKFYKKIFSLDQKKHLDLHKSEETKVRYRQSGRHIQLKNWYSIVISWIQSSLDSLIKISNVQLYNTNQ